MKGFVIKKLANNFWIQCCENNNIFCCLARKNLKNNKIVVGDFVEFNENFNIIEQTYPRKNLLVRPPVSNINQMLIMIAPIPKPDFVVVDKLIIYCKINNIKPILVVNKCDLKDKSLINDIFDEYPDIEIVTCSCLDKNNIDELVKCLNNNITVVAGQSAVGKSSFIKLITNSENIEIGQLSKKINRGKNTTRHCELFKVNNGYIADTPGFTFFDNALLNITSEKLKYFYPIFNEFNCKYSSCNHISEKEEMCGVKSAVNVGKLNKNRYNRYVKIFLEIKEREDNKYGK